MASQTQNDGRSEWFRRHIFVAAGLGLGLGSLGQLLVWLLASGQPDATLGQLLAAILYASAGWVVLGFVLALSTCWMLGRARHVALSVSTVVLGVVCLASAMSSALRIMSGSYLTLGAVQFGIGSLDHFVHAAVEGYAGYFAIIVTVAVAFGVIIAVALRSAAKHPSRPTRGQLALMLGLIVSVTLVYLRRAEHRFVEGMFVSGPLLALVSSFEPDYELDRIGTRATLVGPLAPPGPPAADGAAWTQRLTHHRGSPRPNVLLIMLESIAPAHTTLGGYDRDTTPHLGRLARNGLQMTRAWTTATHSNYAQMAVLSSLFPRRGHSLDMYRRIDYPRMLIHDTFHRLGYDTATVSSQDEDWQGMRRFQDTGTPTFFWAADDYQGDKIDSGVEQYAPDDATTEVALDWLSGWHSEPWSLYLNYQGTHFPYTISSAAERPHQPDEPTWSTFGYLGYPEAERDIVINRYDNALRFVDRQVGRVVDYLVHAGEIDNTLIVITADHGEMFFDRGLVTHGKTLNEIEARVPIIFHWPGQIAPGVRDAPVSHLDIMPTVLDYLGLPPHPSWQGRSFRHASASEVRPIYMNIQGLRHADGLVCWPWKLILERTSKKAYLYHLADDPAERVNLIEAEVEIATRLEDSLSRQLLAQLSYHAGANSNHRRERFQPRLRPCPRL